MDYEKTLKEALNSKATPFEVSSWIEEQFPELKESEGERIRKVLVGFFKNYKEQGTIGAETFNGIPTENILAWLEKQGELKSIEWSGKIGVKHAEGKLKEMLDRKECHAWSEEDKKEIKRIIGLLEGWLSTFKETCYAEDCKCGIVWLKSLKDRYTWKPSEEQMEALDDFIYAKYPNIEKHGAAVKSLYQDLKKLIGE